MQAQVKQTVENIRTVMEEAGGTLDDVVQLRIYTPRIEEYHKTIDFRRKEFPELFGEKPGDGPANSKKIASATKLPDSTIQCHLNDLKALGVVTRQGNTYTYRLKASLKDKIRSIWI